MQQRRPYFAQYPALGSINQVETAANSNYNSLQVQFNQSLLHGVTTKLAYTYGKAIDYVSDPRNTGLSNPHNARLDYAPADFDTRHIFTSFVSYDLPRFSQRFRLLTDGWQDESPSGAPNGQFVMFNRFTRDGRSSLFAVPVAGGQARRLPTPQDGSDPSWSPLLP